MNAWHWYNSTMPSEEVGNSSRDAPAVNADYEVAEYFRAVKLSVLIQLSLASWSNLHRQTEEKQRQCATASSGFSCLPIFSPQLLNKRRRLHQLLNRLPMLKTHRKSW